MGDEKCDDYPRVVMLTLNCIVVFLAISMRSHQTEDVVMATDPGAARSKHQICATEIHRQAALWVLYEASVHVQSP